MSPQDGMSPRGLACFGDSCDFYDPSSMTVWEGSALLFSDRNLVCHQILKSL